MGKNSYLFLGKKTFTNRSAGVNHVAGQADMLRRDLENRFLAPQNRNIGVDVGNLGPPLYIRTEMHHHQHEHTHVHQHSSSLMPQSAPTSLYPPSIVSLIFITIFL